MLIFALFKLSYTLNTNSATEVDFLLSHIQAQIEHIGQREITLWNKYQRNRLS